MVHSDLSLGQDITAAQRHFFGSEGVGDGEPACRRDSNRRRGLVAAHGGPDTVDIANTDYADLPAENRVSSLWDIIRVMDAWAAGEAFGMAFVRAAASENHDRWLERDRQWANARLAVPFEELDRVEQQKDLDVVDVGITAVRAFTAKRPASTLQPWQFAYRPATRIPPPGHHRPPRHDWLTPVELGARQASPPGGLVGGYLWSGASPPIRFELPSCADH